MPKIHEYQAKRLLRECGIAIPEGDVAVVPEEARRIAKSLGKPNSLIIL